MRGVDDMKGEGRDGSSLGILLTGLIVKKNRCPPNVITFPMRLPPTFSLENWLPGTSPAIDLILSSCLRAMATSSGSLLFNAFRRSPSTWQFKSLVNVK